MLLVLLRAASLVFPLPVPPTGPLMLLCVAFTPFYPFLWQMSGNPALPGLIVHPLPVSHLGSARLTVT